MRLSRPASPSSGSSTGAAREALTRRGAGAYAARIMGLAAEVEGGGADTERCRPGG